MSAQDVNARTPLHHASEGLAIEAAHALLNRGANVDALETWRQSLLHRAVNVSEEDRQLRPVR